MAANDQYACFISTPDGPWRNALAVTANDTVDLTNVTGSLWIGGAGNLTVQMAGANKANVSFNSVASGTLMRLEVSRVLNTGTSATLIVALW